MAPPARQRPASPAAGHGWRYTGLVLEGGQFGQGQVDHRSRRQASDAIHDDPPRPGDVVHQQIGGQLAHFLDMCQLGASGDSARTARMAAPSSPRSMAPQARTRTTRSSVLSIAVEEMGRAADARVIAADELLEAEGGLVMWQVKHARGKEPEVLFDGRLVLAGGWHDLGGGDGPRASSRSGETGGRAAPRLAQAASPAESSRRPTAHRRAVGMTISRRFGEGVEQLDRAGDDAAEDVRASSSPALRRREGLGREADELIAGQRHPGSRAQQIGDAVVAHRLEGVRPGNLAFSKSSASRRVQVETVARDDAALVHRIFIRVPQRDQASAAEV